MNAHPRFVSIVCLACAGWLTSCSPPADDPRPNVVVIVLDTLRADHLDLYGYPRETAPFLRELGGASTVFESAFSTSSWTAPATASLFTGEYPARHGVTLGFFAHRQLIEELAESGEATLPLNRMQDELATLPEILSDAGYATLGVSSNMNIGEEMGFERGFDRFYRENMAPAETLIDKLLGWHGRMRRTPPWLAYVHLNDVHSPYTPTDPWYEAGDDEQSDTRAAYDSEIRYVDEQLRRLMRGLDPAGESIVVVVADHGEEFWERGELGHNFSLFQEVNRIALLVRAPGVTPSVIERNVSIIDVLPTLVELIEASSGIELATDWVDGRARAFPGAGISLAGLMRGTDYDDDDPLSWRPLFAHRRDFEHPDRQIWAVMHDRWKLILGDTEPLLFDLAADPGELDNRHADRPEVATALSELLPRYLELASLAPSETEITLDEEKLEQLRSLGYVAE